MDTRSTTRGYFGGAIAVLLGLALAAPAAAQSVPPTFDKSFEPATIGPGSVSTLEFVITNSSGVAVRNMAFTDNLPAGMTIAVPAQPSSTCDGVLSAPESGGTITFADGKIGASSSCTVTVNVTAGVPGTLTNVAGDLTSDAGNSGPATADLVVATDRPGFSKSFSPATVFFGSRSTLTFTIDNTANSSGAANLRFTDVLPSGMEVAGPANVVFDCGGGTVTAVPGSDVVSYVPLYYGDATVGASAACTISVDVVGSSAGDLGNLTGNLTSTLPAGGPERSSGMAGASLTVTSDKIILSKEFVDDPVAPGGVATLRFTVRNLDRGYTAENITFTDDLGAVVGGLAAIGLPVADPCGSGSVLSGTGLLTLTGGILASEGVCTFEVSLQAPSGAPTGAFTNTTSTITADIGGSGETGSPATDLLFIQPSPRLSKTYLDDPVGAGETTTLEFTITNTSSNSSATDITFEDVFDAEFPTAPLVPANGFCGPGSTATYTPLINSPGSSYPAKLVVAGANLGAGQACTFSITLDVAVGAATGTYTNTTSAIEGTVDGQNFFGNAATDSIQVVAAPSLTKRFIDDPVAPGGTVTLEFTLHHDSDAPADATGIAFDDDLTFMAGLVGTGLPIADACGPGNGTLSGSAGDTVLQFSGATLTPGETCTFGVVLQVASTATAGSHTNVTSDVTATVLGVTASENGAQDDLKIAGLNLSKEFIDDPVLPGGTVTLRFTLQNTSPASTATEIDFTDNLDQVVDGLAATSSLPMNDVCGTGSSLAGASGNTFLFFTGGTLAAGASCTFDVVLTVPAGTLSDSYPNLTSPVSASVDGASVTFDPAADVLEVSSEALMLTKEFTDDPVAPGGTVNLRFTLSNLDATSSASNIAFADDLGAALAGLASVGGTMTDVCGPGSSLSGTGVLTFSGGSLVAGASCTFDVPVAVPGSATLGTVATNVTTEVTGTIGVLQVTGGPAIDDLHVAVLDFEKVFGGVAEVGGPVTLSFTITNHGADPVGDLGFNDDLEAVLSGLVATGLPAADVCGAGSLLSGTSVISLTGGSLAGASSCTFTVDLVVPNIDTIVGTYTNVTSDLLQTGLVVADAATADLTVISTADDDGDGVVNSIDDCPGTVIPESVPTVRLGLNRFALVDDDLIFDTKSPVGEGPGLVFTTTETRGCSCEQIIEILQLGEGHVKFGCAIGEMELWSFEIESLESLIFYGGFDTGDTAVWSLTIAE